MAPHREVDPELEAIFARVRAAIDLREVPRAAVEAYARSGGDISDLNRMCQILGHQLATDMTADLDTWLPAAVDDKIRSEIKQRVVDYIDLKFKAIAGMAPPMENRLTNTNNLLGCGLVAAFGFIVMLVVVMGGVLWYVARGPSTPTPGPPWPPAPTPGPTPTPVPTPVAFAQQAQQAFVSDGGQVADATILAAAFDQMAASIQYDKVQPTPRIASRNAMGASFARLQQYRFGAQQTPLAQKFPSFERRVSQEIESRLGTAYSHDVASQLWLEVAQGLKAVQ